MVVSGKLSDDFATQLVLIREVGLQLRNEGPEAPEVRLRRKSQQRGFGMTKHAGVVLAPRLDGRLVRALRLHVAVCTIQPALQPATIISQAFKQLPVALYASLLGRHLCAEAQPMANLSVKRGRLPAGFTCN